nr:YbfB/YjiJ family MFS transporter [Novosphingobium sp. PP1Y]
MSNSQPSTRKPVSFEAAPPGAAKASPAIWRLLLPGLSASLIGIGLARFAYTPMLPALISGGWFNAGQASYLGAANLAGYLIGVVGGALAMRHVGAPRLLRGAMVAATLSFLACAWPAGFFWFLGWRLLSGIGGGITMVLAAPAILPHTPPHRHGIVSGAIFLGVSLGIVLSGTVVPCLLRLGLTPTWLGLAIISALLTVAGWNGWVEPSGKVPASAAITPQPLPVRQLRLLYLAYGLNAFALVPHMLFLVDYVSRGLGRGLESGTHFWVIFGLGSLAGPLIAGRTADRNGYRSTLLSMLVIEAVAIGLPAFLSASVALAISSFVTGACTIGIVPVVLGRTREILRHYPEAQTAAWRSATTSFALLQAAGAYLFSFLLDWSGGDYRLIFAIGSAAMWTAFLTNMSKRSLADTQKMPS